MSVRVAARAQPRFLRLALAGMMGMQVILLLLLGAIIPVYWLLESAAAPSSGSVGLPFVWMMALAVTMVGAALTYAVALIGWTGDRTRGDARPGQQMAVAVSISLILLNVVTLGVVAVVTLEVRDGWELLLSLSALAVGGAFGWFLRLSLRK